MIGPTDMNGVVVSSPDRKSPKSWICEEILDFSHFCECCGTVRYRETSKERFVIKDIMLGIY